MSIQSVIASHFNIDERRAGEWQSVRCPYHNDKRPSAAILFNNTPGSFSVFNCQGCGKSTTINKLAQDLNIDIDKEEWDIRTDWMLDYYNVPSIQKHSNNLKIHVREYANFLTEKKLSQEIVEKYGGEYINDASDKLYGFLRFTYGRKRDRYVARRILEGVGSDPSVRFYNSRTDESGDEGKDGNQGKHLFGIEYLPRDTKIIILCEGITDFLSLQEMSITNCVASFGASPSKPQMFSLRKKTVFILFDNDVAGFEGRQKAYELLKKFEANPIILEIPDSFRRDDEDKIDINSAYCNDRANFEVWIREQINKYNLYDTDYVKSFTQGKAIRAKYFSTGLPELDEVLGGGFATGIHTIGGDTSSGKTTLITGCVDSFTGQGANTLLVTYEVPKPQMWSRLASRYSQYSWQEIEMNMSILEDTCSRQLMRISNNLRIDNDWTIDEVIFAARNFDIIIVDYIQRMPGDLDERKRIVANMTALSNLVNEQNKVVIVVSSVPKSEYGKINVNFKGAGEIEFMSQSAFKIAPFGNSGHTQIACVKNTRGVKDDKIILVKTDFPHQRMSTAPPIQGMEMFK